MILLFSGLEEACEDCDGGARRSWLTLDYSLNFFTFSDITEVVVVVKYYLAYTFFYQIYVSYYSFWTIIFYHLRYMHNLNLYWNDAVRRWYYESCVKGIYAKNNLTCFRSWWDQNLHRDKVSYMVTHSLISEFNTCLLVLGFHHDFRDRVYTYLVWLVSWDIMGQGFHLG